MAAACCGCAVRRNTFFYPRTPTLGAQCMPINDRSSSVMTTLLIRENVFMRLSLEIRHAHVIGNSQPYPKTVYATFLLHLEVSNEATNETSLCVL